MPDGSPIGPRKLAFLIGVCLCAGAWLVWLTLFFGLADFHHYLPIGASAVLTGVLMVASGLLMTAYSIEMIKRNRVRVVDATFQLHQVAVNLTAVVIELAEVKERLAAVEERSASQVVLTQSWSNDVTRVLPAVGRVYMHQDIPEPRRPSGRRRPRQRRSGETTTVPGAPSGVLAAPVAELPPTYMDDVANAVNLGRELERERRRRGGSTDDLAS